jgi:integrase
MWRTYILPQLGKIKVINLTFSDIDTLHRTISSKKPIRANRVLEVIKKALNLAIKWGWINDNPAVGIIKNREEARERYLSDIELQTVLIALKSCKEQNSADAIRMLLLTGARKNEVLSCKWEEFNLTDKIWTKPSSHTKQRRIHRVPLSKQLIELLELIQQKKRSSLFVFPGKEPDKPLTDIKKTWETTRELATAILWRKTASNKNIQELGRKVEEGDNNFFNALELGRKMGLKLPIGIMDVRLHDLRHTYASVLVGNGISLPIVGALLGHTQVQTTMRYAHLADDPLRAATEIAGQVVNKR